MSRTTEHIFLPSRRAFPRPVRSLLAISVISVLATLGNPAWSAESARDCAASDCADNPKSTVTQEIANQGVATGNSSIRLAGGGTVWAVEDPQLARPQLNASAPSLVAFVDGRISGPVRFNVFSNYAAFVERFELRIFRGTDVDLVTPLASVSVPIGNDGTVEWNGALEGAAMLREGDELQYVLQAIAADGSVDETFPRRLQLVRQDELTRNQLRLGASASSTQRDLSAEQLEQRRLLLGSFGESNLRQQNIRIHGSSVRIRGEQMAAGQSVRINGRVVPVDQRGHFIGEYLLPVGQHQFTVDVGGALASREALDINVTGRYLFLVGLADLTVSQNSIAGAMVPVSTDDRYDGTFTEGRLALYLKGKIQGKYLVTVQADTRGQELRHLFRGFLDEDARDVFRRLDPDQYYPIYGDDSSVTRDVDTQGRFYVRVDWDQNQALWGNFVTGINGTEFGQYQRSLYGAALSWRSHAGTELGEARHSLRAFGSQAQSAQGHSEFIGTGGSLYYLKHRDLLPGSDQVVLEVRDRLSGRTEARAVLVRDVDYELDDMQGRMILTRPLLQIVRDNLPSITRDAPLDGFENRLLVDYEYAPEGFDPGQTTAGFRGKTWLGDYVAIGGTYIDESRSGDDYRLAAADLTLQAGRGTYLKLEQARSDATSAPVFFSDDGGLSFSQLNSLTPGRSGVARSVEARANFKELGWTDREWTAAAWWRDVEAGFSVARFDSGLPVREQGAEFAGQLSDAWRLSGRYSDARRGNDSVEQAQLLAEWRASEFDRFTAELRQVQETRAGLGATGLLGAFRYDHRFGSTLDVYGVAQLTLDNDHGAYADNDLYTLGARLRLGELSNVGAEISSGDRGDAITVDGNYFLSPQHSLYLGYTFVDRAAGADPLFATGLPGGLTVGQRWRVSNQVNVFNESQFLKEGSQSGIAHTFGMDFYPDAGWNYGFTLLEGELESVTGTVDRRAVSLNAGRTSPATDWNSKLEYRRDSGSVDREQWVSTTRLLHRFNDDWRLAARVNYSNTQDSSSALGDAKFVESNLGITYRPAANDRLSMLGRVTYLYDRSSPAQSTLSDRDQRSLIVSLEGILRLNSTWEMAGKFGHRAGEARLGRDAGPWFSTTANFAALQARYDLSHRWEALVEYRWLQVTQGDSSRHGFLIGVDRALGENFRVGVGYNFTSFSDDLRVLDYESKGVFLNVTGAF